MITVFDAAARKTKTKKIEWKNIEAEYAENQKAEISRYWTWFYVDFPYQYEWCSCWLHLTVVTRAFSVKNSNTREIYRKVWSLMMNSEEERWVGIVAWGSPSIGTISHPRYPDGGETNSSSWTGSKRFPWIEQWTLGDCSSLVKSGLRLPSSPFRRLLNVTMLKILPKERNNPKR